MTVQEYNTSLLWFNGYVNQKCPLRKIAHNNTDQQRFNPFIMFMIGQNESDTFLLNWNRSCVRLPTSTILRGRKEELKFVSDTIKPHVIFNPSSANHNYYRSQPTQR